MERPWDPDKDNPRLPRRDERLPPPWFERQAEPVEQESLNGAPRRRLSWSRTAGLLALVLLIAWVPIEFAITYRATDSMGRASMTLGFVWAVVIEGLAIWVLTRLMTRR